MKKSDFNFGADMGIDEDVLVSGWDNDQSPEELDQSFRNRWESEQDADLTALNLMFRGYDDEGDDDPNPYAGTYSEE
jgi:hypothetical protein